MAAGDSLRRIVSAASETARQRGYRRPPRVVGFDSFQGLEEAWKGHQPGDFRQDKPPEVPGAEIVVGRFEHTLEGWLRAQPEPRIALVHVDCDLYTGAECALRAIAPHLADGSVIAFDELVHYPGFLDHEWKALYEVAIRDELFRFEWLAHRPHCGWQVSVVIRRP